MEGIIYKQWSKNCKDVINSELDLITPITKLWPLGVVKG